MNYLSMVDESYTKNTSDPFCRKLTLEKKMVVLNKVGAPPQAVCLLPISVETILAIAEWCYTILWLNSTANINYEYTIL